MFHKCALTSDIIQEPLFSPVHTYVDRPPSTVDRLLLRLFFFRIGLLYEVPGKTLIPAHCDDARISRRHGLYELFFILAPSIDR